jgi:hypothetical protein
MLRGSVLWHHFCVVRPFARQVPFRIEEAVFRRKSVCESVITSLGLEMIRRESRTLSDLDGASAQEHSFSSKTLLCIDHEALVVVFPWPPMKVRMPVMVVPGI